MNYDNDKEDILDLLSTIVILTTSLTTVLKDLDPEDPKELSHEDFQEGINTLLDARKIILNIQSKIASRYWRY